MAQLAFAFPQPTVTRYGVRTALPTDELELARVLYSDRPSRNLTRDEAADLLGCERHFLAADLAEELGL